MYILYIERYVDHLQHLKVTSTIIVHNVLSVLSRSVYEIDMTVAGFELDTIYILQTWITIYFKCYFLVIDISKLLTFMKIVWLKPL